MALLVPVGCTRFPVPLRAHVYPSRRLCHTISATLSSRPKAVDWVEKTSSFFENDSRPIMLFDGVCNLCNGGVRFVRANDRQRKIRFEALQSESGRKLLGRSGREPDDISSVVLVEKNRYILHIIILVLKSKFLRNLESGLKNVTINLFFRSAIQK
ncbi:Hypothetical predicted protein [Olea europaea subsp. europaea]|uniref:DCC family protein n=1 Tax=Olea europaea subsp. europaea TaxID=158383 RepID=A0A8S0V671_OLEEU|nr:Hypothetical predicted protein [Olea europaea subsp. europaea]